MSLATFSAQSRNFRMSIVVFCQFGTCIFQYGVTESEPLQTPAAGAGCLQPAQRLTVTNIIKGIAWPLKRFMLPRMVLTLITCFIFYSLNSAAAIQCEAPSALLRSLFISAIRAVPDGDCDIPSGLLNDAAVFVTRYFSNLPRGASQNLNGWRGGLLHSDLRHGAAQKQMLATL